MDLDLLGVLVLGGLFTGLISGLFGVGGGIILVPVQYWVLLRQGTDPDIAMRLAIGTSLLVILPTVIVGAAKHYRKKAVVLPVSITVGLAGAIGGVLGSVVASRLPNEILRDFFSIIILIAAVRMLLKLPAKKREDFRLQAKEFFLWVFFGFFAGCVSGLTGLGGGLVVVPALVIIFKFPMRIAVGTSAATIPMLVLGGVFTYFLRGLTAQGLPPFTWGYLNWLFFIILSACTMPASYLGATLAHRVHTSVLRYLFVLLMFYIGLKMAGIV